MAEFSGQLGTGGVATALTKTAQSLERARLDLDNIDDDRLAHVQQAAYEVPSRASDAVHRLQVSYERFQVLLERKRQKSPSETSQSSRTRRSLHMADGGPVTISQPTTPKPFARPASAYLDRTCDQQLNTPSQDDRLSAGSQQLEDVDCDDGFDIDVNAMVLSTVERLSSKAQTPQTRRTVLQQVEHMTPAQVVEEVFSDDEAPADSFDSEEMRQMPFGSVPSHAVSVTNEDAVASDAGSEASFGESDQTFVDAYSHDQSTSSTGPSKDATSPTQAFGRSEICSATTFSSSPDGAISQFPKAAKRAQVFE